MNRDDLFRCRDDLERHARALSVSKNAKYADTGDAIANYREAGRVMGVPPSLAIVGRMAEQTWRVANLIRDGKLDRDEAWKSFEDLQNFPGLALAAVLEELGSAAPAEASELSADDAERWRQYGITLGAGGSMLLDCDSPEVLEQLRAQDRKPPATLADAGL